MQNDIFDELFSEAKTKEEPEDYRFALLDPPKKDEPSLYDTTKTMDPECILHPYSYKYNIWRTD